MSDRSTVLFLIAVALAAFGLYMAAFVPAMVLGRPEPVLLVGVVLQALCAFVAAVGVWRQQSWAAGAVVLLGVVVAVTWLVEGFVLGIVAYLYALLVAALAVVVAVVIAAYVGRRPGTRLD